MGKKRLRTTLEYFQIYFYFDRLQEGAGRIDVKGAPHTFGGQLAQSTPWKRQWLLSNTKGKFCTRYSDALFWQPSANNKTRL